jgi:RNA polymerase sigma factor (sigma-70 family)
MNETSGAVAQNIQTAYINDLRRILKPLTAAQRIELSNCIQDNVCNPPARNEARALLWEDALRLVLTVEGRIRKRYGLEAQDMDMVQEGNLAAGRAVDSWNPAKGAFSTWVIAHVRGAMLDYLNESSKGGVGSKSSDALMVDMEEGVAYTSETTGQHDTPGSIQAGAITRGELLTYDGVMVGEDVEGASYTPYGFESQDVQADAERLARAVDRLPAIDAEALRAYYGVGVPQQTLAEIASATGYSVSGIRKRITLSKLKVQDLLQDSILRVRAAE